MAKRQVYYTKIWEEEAEPDNPFATKAAYCHGYDVYGEILQKASWFEYLYLIFKGERPTEQQAKLLEKLAIALMNPGPRDASVRAAMNGGVGGSTHAASLMAALAVGAGQYGGSHEIFLALKLLNKCKIDMGLWKNLVLMPDDDFRADIWEPIEHAPGFDPNSISIPSFILDALTNIERSFSGGALTWLLENRSEMESFLGYPLSLSGIASAAFYDLGMDEHQASMLYLIMRLPGAAVHAIEQRSTPWNRFPFFGDSINLIDDPGAKGVPNIEGML